ncbi:MAG: Veg family protein [Clostridia bacterium]|nr:Veg family protein [Clostridia bacterium]
MIKAMQDISKIKRDIRSFHEKRVNVWFNPGRNKIIRYSGVLDGVYPEIFTVSPDDKSFLGKTSYSYTEILCGEVKVTEEKRNIAP